MVNTVVNADPKVTAQILFDSAQEILGLDGMRKVLDRLPPVASASGASASGASASGASASGAPASGVSLSGENDAGQIEDILAAQAGPFLRELQVLYGVPGGRGLALRIGRAVFRYGLKRFGAQVGFRAAEFRLLPAPRRLEKGLRTLAEMIGAECDSSIAVTDEGAHWLWRMDHLDSAGSQEGDPCYLVAGLLQEFTTWAGGGRFYRVVETECQAFGCPACVYQIEKKPLD